MTDTNQVQTIMSKLNIVFKTAEAAGDCLHSKNQNSGFVALKCREHSLCADCVNYQVRMIFDKDKNKKVYFMQVSRKISGNSAVGLANELLIGINRLDVKRSNEHRVISLALNHDEATNISEEILKKTTAEKSVEFNINGAFINEEVNILQETCKLNEYQDKKNNGVVTSYLIEAGGVDWCTQHESRGDS